MAISPKELKDKREKRVEQFKKLVASEEERIDKELLQKAPELGQSVSVNLSRSATKEVIDELIKMYTAKGWKVTPPEQGRPCSILAFVYYGLH